MIDCGQPLGENQTLLQEAFLEKMARELVRMCDVMERHGLVDYEMGIWEEEIMNGEARSSHVYCTFTDVERSATGVSTPSRRRYRRTKWAELTTQYSKIFTAVQVRAQPPPFSIDLFFVTAFSSRAHYILVALWEQKERIFIGRIFSSIYTTEAWFNVSWS